MVLRFIKRPILVVLFLLLSVFYCYAQESSVEQRSTTELSTLDLWSGIELNLNLLEQDQNDMKNQSARDTNNKLGECLQRSTTTLSGLREQLQEIRRRYEEMENLFNSVGNDNNNTWDNDSNSTPVIVE